MRDTSQSGERVRVAHLRWPECSRTLCGRDARPAPVPYGWKRVCRSCSRAASKQGSWFAWVSYILTSDPPMATGWSGQMATSTVANNTHFLFGQNDGSTDAST